MNTENESPKEESIMSELTTLGKNLGAAVRAVLDSPQRYEIEEEVRTGFQSIVTEINDTIAKARTADVSKEMAEQTSKAVETVQTSVFTEELRQGVIKGLRTLNEELNEALTKLEASQQKAAPSAAEPTTAEPVEPTPQAETATADEPVEAAEPAASVEPEEPIEAPAPAEPVASVEPEAKPAPPEPAEAPETTPENDD